VVLARNDDDDETCEVRMYLARDRAQRLVFLAQLISLRCNLLLHLILSTPQIANETNNNNMKTTNATKLAAKPAQIQWQ